MKFYYIGVVLAGIILIIKTFDKEYVEGLNFIFKTTTFHMKAITLFITYAILMALSWITVIKEVDSLRREIWK